MLDMIFFTRGVQPALSLTFGSIQLSFKRLLNLSMSSYENKNLDDATILRISFDC